LRRQCGDCQLCCKLLPVRELGKGANTRCEHQRHHKGCAVYNTASQPAPCRLWSCRWLTQDKTEALRRPDRSHYVIDIMPDFVTIRDEIKGIETTLPVVQIWVDPAYPGAWKDDIAFMNYLARLGEEERMAALVRNGSEEAIFVAPPAINPDGTWFIHDSGVRDATHTPEDFLRAGYLMEFKEEAET
jgi:hypothetical protein